MFDAVRIARPPPVFNSPPLPLIAPLTLMLVAAGGAKTRTAVVQHALPGSEPGLVAPSPTCSVPAEIVVPPEKVLSVLVSTTAPPVAVLLTPRLVGPATSDQRRLEDQRAAAAAQAVVRAAGREHPAVALGIEGAEADERQTGVEAAAEVDGLVLVGRGDDHRAARTGVQGRQEIVVQIADLLADDPGGADVDRRRTVIGGNGSDGTVQQRAGIAPSCCRPCRWAR